MSEALVTRRKALVEREDCDLFDRRRGRSARSRLPTRNAVTLIELLIVVTIITILSAVFLGASRSAIELARTSRTKSTISKIHTLLGEHWVSYATRRVVLNPSLTNALENNLTGPSRGQAMADARLLALRELMKLEMPDRWSDILGTGVGNPYAAIPTQVLDSYPTLRNAYLRRYESIIQGKDLGDAQVVEAIQANQGAECLYMIVMLATGDGEARTLFSTQDIGDTDGDGAPEFLDGWGNSIQFIRWPAGFVSDLQPVDPLSGNRLPGQDRDPFDLFRRDQVGITVPLINDYPNPLRAHVAMMRNRHTTGISAYRILPLIYSRGLDANTDMVVDTGALVSLDPYASVYGSSGNEQLAFVKDTNNDGDDNSVDNIHNHLQDNK